VLGSTPPDIEEANAAVRDVVVWMRDEGLIRIESLAESLGGSFSADGVQLTSRGIAILQQKTSDSELGKTLETTLSEPEKAGELSASIYVKIGSFVGGALGGFTKAIS
jgi:hypothetical protein